MNAINLKNFFWIKNLFGKNIKYFISFLSQEEFCQDVFCAVFEDGRDEVDFTQNTISPENGDFA